MDQWGLEVSLLPSLAVCGSGSLDLQSSQDPSVLCFGTSKEKSTLQAGSPQGLMAYLYARYYYWGFCSCVWACAFLLSRDNSLINNLSDCCIAYMIPNEFRIFSIWVMEWHHSCFPKKLHNYSTFQAYCLKPLHQQAKYLHNYNSNCSLVQYYNSTIYYTILCSTPSTSARTESPLSRQITTFNSVLSK